MVNTVFLTKEDTIMKTIPAKRTPWFSQARAAQRVVL